jgi:tRNA(fMet)-specific endonuclease VapC
MKILDTDGCIEILRGNQRVIARRRESLDEVATTWITTAELSYGAAKSRAPVTNQNLVIEFLSTLSVIGLNLPAVEQFGRIKAALERQGNRVADAYLFIAAIALAQGATLITGNLHHYERMPELLIEDWIRGA